MTTLPTPRPSPLDDLVRDLTGTDLAALDDGASLDGLLRDSLATVELLLAIEAELDRSVALEALTSLATVGDLRALLADLADPRTVQR